MYNVVTTFQEGVATSSKDDVTTLTERLQQQSSAFYCTSHLYDDGVILPRDTRQVRHWVLAFSLIYQNVIPLKLMSPRRGFSGYVRAAGARLDVCRPAPRQIVTDMRSGNETICIFAVICLFFCLFFMILIHVCAMMYMYMYVYV